MHATGVVVSQPELCLAEGISLLLRLTWFVDARSQAIRQNLQSIALHCPLLVSAAVPDAYDRSSRSHISSVAKWHPPRFSAVSAAIEGVEHSTSPRFHTRPRDDKKRGRGERTRPNRDRSLKGKKSKIHNVNMVLVNSCPDGDCPRLQKFGWDVLVPGGLPIGRLPTRFRRRYLVTREAVARHRQRFEAMRDLPRSGSRADQ